MIPIAISFVLIVILGVPFTLWWWKLADRWADAEHKRFAEKPDEREEVTIDDQAGAEQNDTSSELP